MLTIQFDLAHMTYEVVDGTLNIPGPTPDAPPATLAIKMMRVLDTQAGVVVEIPLPSELPPPDPNNPLPPDFKPPAVAIAAMLTDHKPKVEIARAMPTFQDHQPKRR